MLRQVVKRDSIAPNLEWTYEDHGPRVARSQSERSPVQTTTIARDPVPLPALPAPA